MVMQDLRALAIWGRGDEKELKKKKKNWNLEQHNYTLPTCLSPYIKGQLKKTLHKEILQ